MTEEGRQVNATGARDATASGSAHSGVQGTGRPTPETPSTDPSSASQMRSSWTSRITRSQPCHGELTILENRSVTEITTDCDSISVVGDGIVVLARGATEVSIIGDECLVLVSTVQTIDIVGDDNQVYWTDGAPHVDTVGSANTTKQSP